MKTIPVSKIEALMKRHGVSIKNNSYTEALECCEIPDKEPEIDEKELSAHGLCFVKEETA